MAAKPKAINELRMAYARKANAASIFFDLDNNRLQITAHASNQPEELLSDAEKWRRIIANRTEQGRGLSRWESGGKKLL